MDGQAQGAEVGAVVVTPGEILAEMDTVDAAVRQLDAEVGTVPVTATFKQGWAAFGVEWRKFYDEHKGLTGRIWTEVYRQTLAYRRRVEEWFASFAREGWHALTESKSEIAARASASAPDLAATSGYSFGTLALVAAGAALVAGLVVYASKE
jgi:hypothetical protein